MRQDGIGDNFRFHLLFNVTRLVLITPHYNASIERVYALVKKNKTDSSDRNRLDPKGTLSTILAVKLERPEERCKCYHNKSEKSLLSEAKRATTRYNNFHHTEKR